MAYQEMLSDNDQKVGRIIATTLRIGSYLILMILILSYFDILQVHNTFFRKDLILSSILLFIPTILVEFFKITKSWIKYIIITSVTLATIFIMCHFLEATILMVALPLAIASLYLDKRLCIYTICITSIGLISANVMNAYSMGKVIEGTLRVEMNVFYRMLIGLCQLSFLSFISLCISQRSVKLFEKASYDSTELKRNRDGLDVIVDHIDTLFCARTYQEVMAITLFIIKNLFASIGNIPQQMEGYIGVRESKDSFYAISESMLPKQFWVQDKEVTVSVGEEQYTIPIAESKESSTVFVNKNKLTMFFYSEKELVVFVILHINLEKTDEVLNKLVRVLYRNIRLAINNVKLSNDMYETQEEIVRAFSEISESKSGQTGRHIKRVSEYMKIMAEAIELDNEEKDSLVIASMMHDIGKLLIPESIIEKPGKLTKEEFAVIKTHVNLGYKLLEYSPGRIMEIARIIALQHHEKWDGTGYLGMKGEEIDYYSRIMAVVDVFDALMSRRSYKESWSIDETYNEIVSQSGKHFDPHIVELFKIHFNEFLYVLMQYPDCERTA